MNRLRKKSIHNTLKNKKPRYKLKERVKNLYNENYKTLKKEIEEDTRRQKSLP
jgi:hypothetical protein